MDSGATNTAGCPLFGAATLAGAKRCREEGPQEVAANAGTSLPRGQQPTTSPAEAGGHEDDLVAGSAKRPHHASLTTVGKPAPTGEAPPPSPSLFVPPPSTNTEPATRAVAATTAAPGAAADAAELVPVGVTSIPPAISSAAVVVPAGAAVAHQPPAPQPSPASSSPPPSQAAAAAAVSKSPSGGRVAGSDPSAGVAGIVVARPAGDVAGAGGDEAGAGDAGAAGGADGTVVAAKAEVEKCQVCHQQERRYCCPRCGKLTCSLPCCVRHKKEEGCNGQRDKVAFVGLKDFTDVHLRSDFNFLEDALRCVDGGRRALARRPGVLGKPRQQRNSSGRGGRGRGRGRGRQQPRGGGAGSVGGGGDDGGVDGDGGGGDADQGKDGQGEGGALGLLSARGQGWLAGRTPKLQRLVKEAAIRGTRLLLMPDGMARRDGNTTTVAGAPGRGRRFSGKGRGGGGRGGGGRGRGRGGAGRGPGRAVAGDGGGDGDSGDANGTKQAVTAAGAADPPAAGAAKPPALKGTCASQTEAMAPPDSPAPRAAGSAREAVPGESASKAPETPPVPSGASSSPSSTSRGIQGASATEGSSATAPTSHDLLEIERRLSAAGRGVGGGHGANSSSGGGGGGGSKSSSGGGGGGDAGVGISVAAPPKTTVLWKVEWVFCSAMAGGGRGNSGAAAAAATATAGTDKSGDVTVSDPSVSEELFLFEALSKYLEPRPGNAPLRHRLKRFSKPWTHDTASSGSRPADGATATISGEKCGGIGADSGTRAEAVSSISTASPALDVIAGAGARRQQQGRPQRQLRLFLQRVPCAAKAPLYWELDCWERLGDALKGKTVIEYPTVYVTVRDDKGGATARQFRTLVSDVDDVAPVAAATAAPGPGCDPAALILGEVEKALAPPPPPPPPPPLPSLDLDEQQLLSGVGAASALGAAPMDVASEEEEETDESESESESDSGSSSDSSSSSSSDSGEDEEIVEGIPPRPAFL